MTENISQIKQKKTHEFPKCNNMYQKNLVTTQHASRRLFMNDETTVHDGSQRKTLPVRIQFVQRRRCVALLVAVDDGQRSRLERRDLLILDDRTLERLTHVNVL